MIARSKNKGMGGISRLGSLKREKGAAVDDIYRHRTLFTLELKTDHRFLPPAFELQLWILLIRFGRLTSLVIKVKSKEAAGQLPRNYGNT